MVRIGYFSLPVVGLTAFFTGGVLALQIYLGGNRFGAEAIVPQVVVLAVTRELGPVIAGLMIAGRVGAAIAAEIGTMKVTEQIDALTTLATNPVKYLVVPRIVAAVISMPILTAIGDSIGVLGGYVLAVYYLDFNGTSYLKNTVDFAHQEDITSGLIKAAVFGFIVALLGCYNGFNSKGGAQGVGAATTNAVVASSILILLADYVLTALLFHK
jgi:phospholipid/cholesterol/gamma-HCH transport system permease protein